MACDPVQLSNPPIREALIDIQVAGHPSGIALETLADSIVRDGHLTTKKPIREGVFGIQLNPSDPIKTVTEDRGIVGYRLEDPANSRVLQLRSNGCTFSILSGYTNWDAMKEEGLPLLRRFLQIEGIQQIRRVALRYINSIALPGTTVDLDEYFSAPPHIPSSLPQSLSSFFSRVVVPLPDQELTAIVTQALEGGSATEVPVLLDIDVFGEVELSPVEQEWEPILEVIRKWKNQLFFGFITPKTRDLYI